VPRNNPIPLAPQKMLCFNEVYRYLDGCITLWDTMANEDLSREF